MSLDQSQVMRYLTLLGIPKREPSLESLKGIVYAHVTKVPFENISKLYRWRISEVRELVDCSQYLDGIEQYHFGGTCYTNNYYLCQLLIALGYDVLLCGADMSKPDVHIVSIVRIDEREYIVDVGYAAPFFEPLPRDLSSEFEIALGNDRYVLSPKDPTGRSRLTLCRNGEPKHGYLVNPRSRRIEDFQEIIADSFKPSATFMNAVLLVKFGAGYSIVLHNMTYIESRGTSSRRMDLKSTDELVKAIEKHFFIPSFISRIALDGLRMTQDAWS